MLESIAGLSLKRKSAPSRASRASMSEDNISGAVSEKSLSAVMAGPRSLNASKVRSSRRKLFFVAPTAQAARILQSELTLPRYIAH